MSVLWLPTNVTASVGICWDLVLVNYRIINFANQKIMFEMIENFNVYFPFTGYVIVSATH